MMSDSKVWNMSGMRAECLSTPELGKPSQVIDSQGLLSGGVDGTRTRDPRRDRPMRQALIHAGFGPSGYSKDRPIRAVPSLEPARAHSNVFGSLARATARLSQPFPSRSYFAHSAGVRRTERGTVRSSGGSSGRPRARFSSSVM